MKEKELIQLGDKKAKKKEKRIIIMVYVLIAVVFAIIGWKFYQDSQNVMYIAPMPMDYIQDTNTTVV